MLEGGAEETDTALGNGMLGLGRAPGTRQPYLINASILDLGCHVGSHRPFWI